MKVLGQSFIGARLAGVLCPIVVAILAAAPASVSPQFDIPPLAADVVGPIAQIELSPVFAQRYVCVEHALELTHAGDALGTDCQVTGAVEIGSNGFSKLYRSDGKTNADWHGWHADVLAPFDGKVVYVFQSSEENAPGVLGSTPAGTLRFENAAGVIVNYGHVEGQRHSESRPNSCKSRQQRLVTCAAYPYRRLSQAGHHAVADSLEPSGNG
jgi:hypothetical protein